MSKLKLKISNNTSLNLSVPELKRNFWPYYLLSSIQYAALMFFVGLALIGVVSSDQDSVYYFKLSMIIALIIGTAQLLKCLLGGLKFLAQSQFDLVSLLLLIALISTLLVKQVLDIVDVEGMFPNQQYWFITIWGMLVLLGLSYLIDMISRERTWLRFLFWFSGIVFELLIVLRLLIDGDIKANTAVLILAALPLIVSPVFTAVKLRDRLLLLFNFAAMLILALLNLTLDYMIIVLISGLIVVLALAVLGELRINEFKNMVKQIWMKKFSGLKERSLLNWGIVAFCVVMAVSLFIRFAAGSETFFLKDALDSDVDIVTSADDVQSFLIGDSFSAYGTTTLEDLFYSYGLLGTVIFSGLLVYAIVWNFREYSLTRAKKIVNPIMLLLMGSSMLSVFVMLIFSNILSELAILLFVLLGITSASHAMIWNRKMKVSYMRIKGIRKNYVKIFNVVRIVGALVLIFASGYVIFNLEEIFLA